MPLPAFGFYRDCFWSTFEIKRIQRGEVTLEPPTASPAQSDLTLSPDLPGADQVPDLGPMTILLTGWNGPLSNLLQLPQSGQIWIVYEYGDALAATIYLWHQGGATQPINLGWNNFSVHAGDAIIWTLSSPNNSIKVGYQYV